MKLRDYILERHSKEHTAAVVAFIGTDKGLFEEIISFMTGNEKRLAQRAAWVASEVTRIHPDLVKRHLKTMVGNLKNKETDNAVKRNTLRLLQWIKIPSSIHGDLMNICFGIIISNNEPPAVKANALTVLNNLRENYPDIKDELRTAIESGFDTESPAFKSRASKILRELQRSKQSR